LPAEFARPGSLVRRLVDVELELPEQVVLVLGRPLDDPEVALGEAGGAGRRPRNALPLRVHVADEWNVGPHRVPRLLRLYPPADRLAGEVRLLADAQLRPLADELPFEVLGLAVEERAVVLARVGAEEAVGAVRRR